MDQQRPGLFDRARLSACPHCAARCGLRCYTRFGRPRSPHLARLALQLAKDVVDANDVGPQEVGRDRLLRAEVEASPWARQADALVTAGQLLHRAANLIEQAEDTTVVADTRELRDRVDHLVADITAAASWAARADTDTDGDVDGLAGLTPDLLEAELVAREVAAYDTALRARLPPPSTPTEVTVFYSLDGQVTVPGLGAAGGVVVGYAPTPTAALDLVATAATPQGPVMTLRSAETTARRPADYTGQDDLDVYSALRAALADTAAPQLQQHLQACRDRQHDLAGVELTKHLDARAVELNHHEPQLPPGLEDLVARIDHRDPALGDRAIPAVGRMVAWVPTRLVVHTTRTPQWNDFADAGPDTVPQIAAALRDAHDLESFTRRMFTKGQIILDAVTGPSGPLYTLTTDGHHRTHLARLLDLPFLLAEVTVHTLPRQVALLTVVANEPGRPDDPVTDDELLARWELWEGLRRRGLVEADTDESQHWSLTTLQCRRLPAVWWLSSAAVATRVNAEYERLYPGALATLGVPIETGTNPEAWTTWLTS